MGTACSTLGSRFYTPADQCAVGIYRNLRNTLGCLLKRKYVEESERRQSTQLEGNRVCKLSRRSSQTLGKEEKSELTNSQQTDKQTNKQASKQANKRRKNKQKKHLVVVRKKKNHRMNLGTSIASTSTSSASSTISSAVLTSSVTSTFTFGTVVTAAAASAADSLQPFF